MDKNNQNSIDYLDEVYSDLEEENYNFAYDFTSECIEAILDDDDIQLDNIIEEFKQSVMQSFESIKESKSKEDIES